MLESVDSQPAIRGLQQTAYQVLVSSSEPMLQANQGDLWNSGQVPSDAHFNVVYPGRPLPS
jgi:alpha-L-rhamnosidase